MPYAPSSEPADQPQTPQEIVGGYHVSVPETGDGGVPESADVTSHDAVLQEARNAVAGIYDQMAAETNQHQAGIPREELGQELEPSSQELERRM